MSRTIQMLNEDGTPFFANLHAPSTVTITINEAFTLVDALKAQRTFNQDLVLNSNMPGTMLDTFAKMDADLKARIADLEATIDHDKYAQWAAVAPAWAIRAGAR